MFERNRVDNTPEPSFVPVAMVLACGDEIGGRLAVPIGRTTVDAINSPAPFIEFEPHGGQRRFIAKAQIAEIRLVSVPGVSQLQPRARQPDDFEPRSILGLENDATWETVRQAYLDLSKTYHPDRYSGMVLPAEVQDYFESMARRINAAYAALESVHRSRRRAEAARTAPVYTSGPKG